MMNSERYPPPSSSREHNNHYHEDRSHRKREEIEEDYQRHHGRNHYDQTRMRHDNQPGPLREGGHSSSFYERDRPRPSKESHERGAPQEQQRETDYERPQNKKEMELNKDKSFPRKDSDYEREHKHHHERKREEKYHGSKSHRGRDSRSRSRSPSASPSSRRLGRRHKSSRREEEFDIEDDLIPLDQWPKKLKNWDIHPKGFDGMTVDQVKNTGLFIPPAYQPKVTNLTPFVDPNRAALMLQSASDPSSISAITSNLNPILAKQTRRIYVSGLPQELNQEEISKIFNNLMDNYKFSTKSGSSVADVVPNPDKNYAFIDFYTPEEATNAMNFDGLQYNGYILKVRRPKDYQPLSALEQGGALGSISGLVADSPNKIYIGNVPLTLTEEQVIELLKPFGDLKSFHLVREGPAGISKGFAFCEYMDSEITDIACAGLNGLELGDKKLVLQRANTGMNKPFTGGQTMPAYAAGAASAAIIPTLLAKGQGQPTTVIQLLNMVQAEELLDDNEYNDILEDVKTECSKFGKVVDIYIPRPIHGQPHSTAVGKIFIQYEDTKQSSAALVALAGRKFADNTVLTAYFSLDQFKNRDF